MPDYGRHVAEQVARLGRQHPLVRTQYFNEELASADGLFNPARLALMQGEHAEQFSPAARSTVCAHAGCGWGGSGPP